MDKKKVVLGFLKKNNKGYSQGMLARLLMKKLGYKNVQTARVSIGKLLFQLKSEGIVRYESKSSSNGLPSNIWYLENG